MTTSTLEQMRIEGILEEADADTGTSDAAAARPRRPLRAEVVGAIAREAQLRPRYAGQFADWFVEIVFKMRRTNYAPHYLDDVEMTAYHGTLNQLFPDGTQAEEGSAGYLLERYALDPGRCEVRIIHDADEDGDVRYCTARIMVDFTSTAERK